MTIETNKDGSKLTVGIGGRLDTTTAPELEQALKGALDDITELVLDLKDLEYVSSAGLRVMLAAQKTMNKQGTMTIVNVGHDIMEIFEVTGFVDILTIEES